jgi:hypothetical protein
MGTPILIQSRSELESGILKLEATYDALVREIARRDQELIMLDHQIKQETKKLADIRAEIQKHKTFFGV